MGISSWFYHVETGRQTQPHAGLQAPSNDHAIKDQTLGAHRWRPGHVQQDNGFQQSFGVDSPMSMRNSSNSMSHGFAGASILGRNNGLGSVAPEAFHMPQLHPFSQPSIISQPASSHPIPFLNRGVGGQVGPQVHTMSWPQFSPPKLPDLNKLHPAQLMRVIKWLQHGVKLGEIDLGSLSDCPRWLRQAENRLPVYPDAPGPSISQLQPRLSAASLSGANSFTGSEQASLNAESRERVLHMLQALQRQTSFDQSSQADILHQGSEIFRGNPTPLQNMSQPVGDLSGLPAIDERHVSLLKQQQMILAGIHDPNMIDSHLQ